MGVFDFIYLDSLRTLFLLVLCTPIRCSNPHMPLCMLRFCAPCLLQIPQHKRILKEVYGIELAAEVNDFKHQLCFDNTIIKLFFCIVLYTYTFNENTVIACFTQTTMLANPKNEELCGFASIQCLRTQFLSSGN